jgi:hypothetical protein
MGRSSVRTLINVILCLYPGLDIRIASELHARLTEIIKHLMANHSAYPDCVQASIALTGISHPIEKLYEILQVPSDPILSSESPEGATSRRKSHPWSSYEDSRLLSGIYRYGVENWTTISHFVGNGRTRSQCSQRWQRGLDPRLSKDPWTYAEDVCLLRFVQTCGEKAWTRIAAKMGNRSDVQCRYRYGQLRRETAPPPGIRKAQSGSISGQPQTAVASTPPPVRGSQSVPALPFAALVAEPIGPAKKPGTEETGNDRVRRDIFGRVTSSGDEELVWD